MVMAAQGNNIEDCMKTLLNLTAATALALTGVAATAQTDTTTPTEAQRTTTRDRLGAIFGALFGDRTGGSENLDAQWALGRTPLATQRTQFDARVDAEVRSGAISSYTGTRLKNEYADLVMLETRYGADRRFTTAERTELADRYGTLTQVLAQGGYSDDYGAGTGAGETGGALDVAGGQAEFNRRVDAQVAARRITRTTGTQLRSEYTTVIGLERSYLRDGRLTASERADLEARLDDLDARVGDVGYGGGATVLTPRARLDAIARALPSAGLTTAARTQLLVEHGDLMRLESAYARITPTADDRAYLDRRIADLEIRARIRR